jgi:hypothetical protein
MRLVQAFEIDPCVDRPALQQFHCGPTAIGYFQEVCYIHLEVTRYASRFVRI